MATALVVDDSRVMRRVLKSALTGMGFAVREAANGQEALAAVEEMAPEVVLLDWNMPEMDGLEVLKRLRERPELSSLAIVMVTAETELERIAEALEAGANEYVMKPFTDEILAGKLELAGVQVWGA